MSDVDAQAWALRPDGAAGPFVGDWFQQRLARARALLPDAEFDTVIGDDYGGSVTSELADVVGVADANPNTDERAGVVNVEVGDAVITPSQARLSLTGSSSHVELLSQPFYAAAVAKFAGPDDVPQLGDTEADMIALWGDDSNRVMLGVLGNASGGSTSNWVGAVVNASTTFTTLGPALDGESNVWHLFEFWSDGQNEVHFAIDGVEFAGTIDAANLPAVSARLGPIVRRTAIGDPALVLWDKQAVVVRSPTPGES